MMTNDDKQCGNAAMAVQKAGAINNDGDDDNDGDDQSNLPGACICSMRVTREPAASGAWFLFLCSVSVSVSVHSV